MKKLALLFILLFALKAQSQDIQYKIILDGIGDNREYFNDYGYPQTILGSRMAAEAGFNSENSKFRIGVSYLYEFGSKIDAQKPIPTLYYEFSNQKINFLFGAFPRRGKIDFPLAMLTDTFLYYRPNIEGLYGKYTWKWGWQNAFVDWLSRQTNIDKEMFTAGASGEIFSDNFFIENFVLITHVATPMIKTPDMHINDYAGFSIRAGVRTKPSSRISAYLKAGILNSELRERSVTDGFMSSTSFIAEAYGKWKNFGVKSVLHSGDSQRFAFGDHFYHAENYLRTDLFWYFLNSEKIKGHFNWSLHVIDWEELNHQQQLSVIYVFGN